MPANSAVAERFDPELHRLARFDHARVALLDARPQLQRVHLHDGGHHRPLADELADLHRPLRDHARDGRPDDRVAELLERERVGRPPVPQLRLGGADRIERRLVAGFGHLVPGFRCLQHLGRRDAAGVERLRPLVRARASSRFAVAVLTDAISSSGGGTSAVSTGPFMPSWARVWSSAASARSRASASSRGSISTSGAPTPTSRPISTTTWRTTPAASELTRAWSGESSVPARSI